MVPVTVDQYDIQALLVNQIIVALFCIVCEHDLTTDLLEDDLGDIGCC